MTRPHPAGREPESSQVPPWYRDPWPWVAIASPAIAVIGAQDYGVRFFGIPSGYEFMSLLDSITLAPRSASWYAQRARRACSSSPKSLAV